MHRLICGDSTSADVAGRLLGNVKPLLVMVTDPLEMNARARWLVRSNGYAADAIESWAANTVGDGISSNSSTAQASRKDAVQRLWLAFEELFACRCMP